jgi:hypothetical protein
MINMESVPTVLVFLSPCAKFPSSLPNGELLVFGDGLASDRMDDGCTEVVNVDG